MSALDNLFQSQPNKKKDSTKKKISAIDSLFSEKNTKGTLGYVPRADLPKEEPKKTLGSKVKDFGKEAAAGLVKPFAEVGTNLVQAADIATGGKGEVTPFSGKFLGEVSGLGRIDITKSPLEKENLRSLKKSVGVGTEIAATIAGGGATKDILGNIIKPTIKQLAKEGAILSGTYALGNSIEQNMGLVDTAKNVAINTGAGAVLGPVIGKTMEGVGKLFGKKAPAVIEETLTKEATKPAPGPIYQPSIPDAYQPPAYKTNIPKVNTTISKGEKPSFIYEKGEIKALNIKTGEARTIGSFNDINPKTASDLTKAYYNLKDIGNGIKTGDINVAEAKLEKLKQKALTELQQKGTVSIPTSAPRPTPTYNTNIPEAAAPKLSTSIKGDTVAKASSDINKQIIEDGFNALPEEELAKYNSVSRSKQVDDIKRLIDTDPDSAIAMALSGKGIPKEIDSQILFNTAKGKASQIFAETGDNSLQRELAKSPLAAQRSELAQKLGAAATLNDPGDAVSIMQNINVDLQKIAEKKAGKKVSEVVNEDFQNLTKQKERVKVTKQSFSEFINSIQC